MDRRYFLKSSGISIASLGVATTIPSFLTRTLAYNEKTGKRKILITIFQRGAMDGLNAVIPYGDQDYYKLRNAIAVPPPSKDAGQGTAIDLDGFFGLNPGLSSFKPVFDNKELAIIHASGSPDNTRSHFDAQDYMESGTPGMKSTRDGWLNRYLALKEDKKQSPFRAVSMGTTLPRTLHGKSAAISINNIKDFAVRGGKDSQALQGGFEAMYEQTANDALKDTGKETFDAVNMLKKINPAQYKPADGIVYPKNVYGNRLMQIAQLIKSDIGLEVAFTDIGGWDTHTNQGGAAGQLANRLTEFSTGITALYQDLKDYADDVTILTMTEFGRTAKENGNRGTDHGHASVMFVLGGNVNGGKVYGKWPGLSSEKLNEGRDLAITTDFRDVFAEVSMKHMGATNLTPVFPGYQIKNSNFKGIF